MIKNLGKHIKQLRTQLGWSQSKLSLKCGWPKSGARISNYEQDNEKGIPLDALMLLAEVFKDAFGEDKLIYLLTGHDDELSKQEITDKNKQNFLHVSQVGPIITNVLVNAEKLGLIVIPNSGKQAQVIIKNIVDDFKEAASSTDE